MQKESISKNVFNALSKILICLILISLAFIILYPFIFKIFGSLKSVDDLYDTSIQLIPKHWSFDIFREAISAMNYFGALKNSVFISVLVGVLQMFSSAMIGYGLARFKFVGRNLLYGLVIATLLIPVETIMTSLFLEFRYFDIFGLVELFAGKPLNLINTPFPFVLLSITGLGLKNGLYIYLSMQMFSGLPRELEEAASVDGAKPFRTFLQVMLPNAVPTLVTIFLFSFCWQWTDEYYANIFMGNMDVLSNCIYNITTTGSGKIDAVVVSSMANAAMLLVIMPLVILYVCCQRFFIQGIAKSGIVG